MSRRVLLLAAGLALAACSDGPESGPVSVIVSGANPARSVELRVVGPVTSYQAASPVIAIYPTQLGGDTLSIIAVAAAGHTINGVPLARLQVADVDVARGYPTQVLEVAAGNYALQNASAYSVSIVH